MKKSDSQPEHNCLDFDNSTIIPARWRGLLSCRQYKLKLTHYTANAMLDIAPSFLSDDQEFITNIAEVAYSTNSDKEKLPRPTLYSNTDESDNRIWLHCVHSHGTKKLLYSPDTDIYHIGLTITPSISDQYIIVQLSKSCTVTVSPRFVDMKALCKAIELDPDLSSIPSPHRCQVLQTIYVATGCDYVSLCWHGKSYISIHLFSIFKFHC